MFKLSGRLLFTSVLILSCAQLVTGCLTTGSAVKAEAPIAIAPPLTNTSTNQQSASWSADAWRASWDQIHNRSGRDSSAGFGSDYRDLEAALWVQNDSHGSSMLSTLRSSGRGGSSFWAPSDSWGSSGSRFRTSEGAFGDASRSVLRSAPAAVR
jgi:hypothetical protein